MHVRVCTGEYSSIKQVEKPFSLDFMLQKFMLQ